MSSAHCRWRTRRWRQLVRRTGVNATSFRRTPFIRWAPSSDPPFFTSTAQQSPSLPAVFSNPSPTFRRWLIGGRLHTAGWRSSLRRETAVATAAPFVSAAISRHDVTGANFSVVLVIMTTNAGVFAHFRFFLEAFTLKIDFYLAVL